MEYKRLFDPSAPAGAALALDGAGPQPLGDRRDGSVYVYQDEIILAVNVAMATGRPLLVRGPAGSGKSSLARNVARHLGYRYYEEVISSRTQARELQWRFDVLRRLSDAQVRQLKENAAAYVEPGVLWWAFDRESAARRGAPPDTAGVPRAVDPAQEGGGARAVVLLDEIDKADPDEPNNLLVPLGSLQFIVLETGCKVEAAAPPLLFLTTNDERQLSAAFLRRCIALALSAPDEDRLVEIARAHLGEDASGLDRAIAKRVIELGQQAGRSEQAVPSTAEYLDAVHACRTLKVRADDEKDPTWSAIRQATLTKPRERGRGG